MSEAKAEILTLNELFRQFSLETGDELDSQMRRHLTSEPALASCIEFFKRYGDARIIPGPVCRTCLGVGKVGEDMGDRVITDTCPTCHGEQPPVSIVTDWGGWIASVAYQLEIVPEDSRELTDAHIEGAAERLAIELLGGRVEVASALGRVVEWGGEKWLTADGVPDHKVATNGEVLVAGDRIALLERRTG